MQLEHGERILYLRMRTVRTAYPAAVALAAVLVGACFNQNDPSSFSGGQGQDAGDAGDGGNEGAATGDGGCPILTSTLVVVVVDAVNGADVCDATVYLSGPVNMTLAMQGNPATCAYSAGFPPPPAGTYTVSASAPNYLSVTQTGVVITQDACGTEAPTVTIQLPVPPRDAGPG